MVALHPEGVDRNFRLHAVFEFGAGVALHPEGVDRNLHHGDFFGKIIMSPSTRRAWIEICLWFMNLRTVRVALHPEGVDRNTVKVHCGGKSECRPPPGGRG